MTSDESLRAELDERSMSSVISVAHANAILLLSGGLDSTALAALLRPALCLVVDYGQRSARGEVRAASAVCRALDLELQVQHIDLGGLGGGLLHDEEPLIDAPSPEWWPYRNQILVTIAASVALRERLSRVVIGSVASDGVRHVDGTESFYSVLDNIMSMQEGNVHVEAPAIAETTADIVARSGLGEDVLGWTLSCHRAEFPCGACPGCWKRRKVLDELGLLLERDH